MRDSLHSSAGSAGYAREGVYTPFSKNVDKFIEQLRSKTPNPTFNSRPPSPSMQDWKVDSRAPSPSLQDWKVDARGRSPSMQDWKLVSGNKGNSQGTPHEEISILRSDVYRSPSPSISGQDTTRVLEWQNAKRLERPNVMQLVRPFSKSAANSARLF